MIKGGFFFSSRVVFIHHDSNNRNNGTTDVVGVTTTKNRKREESEVLLWLEQVLDTYLDLDQQVRQVEQQVESLQRYQDENIVCLARMAIHQYNNSK